MVDGEPMKIDLELQDCGGAERTDVLVVAQASVLVAVSLIEIRLWERRVDWIYRNRIDQYNPIIRLAFKIIRNRSMKRL